MKKKLLLLLLCFSCAATAMASHIYGGEMIYEYLGPGATAGTKKYRITLKLFRDQDGGGAELPLEAWIGVFDYGTKQHFPSSQTHYVVPRTTGPTQVNVNISPCITGNIIANYTLATYSFEIDLPDNLQGYIASYETCCRVNGLENVLHSGSPQGGGAGSTYVARIPGTLLLGSTLTNSSPQFVTSLDLVCFNKPFTWNFSATDPNGDSLVYSFTEAYDKTKAQSAANVAPAPPSSGVSDYPQLSYINGYTPDQPLGNLVSINPRTGIISGIAPPVGKYVVAVLIKEYRNGNLIGEHRKDFILRVQDCNIAAAQLRPEYISCDGYTYTFQNEAGPNPLITSYYWEVGDGSTFIDEKPTHTYADTGVYKIKLVINRGQACADSATSVIRVYPGFFPGFDFTGICINKPTQFRDTSKTRYGVVNFWSWNFGDNATQADTSRLKNPSYTYSQTGPKQVQFIVASDKGCRDTITNTVTILDKPPLSVAFKDTLICKGDALQLQAIGNGNFTWTPNVNVTNANTANPTVNPTTTTVYKVELNDNGCLNYDSVKVNVVDFVTLIPRSDTTICLTDSVQLSATSNGLRYQWSPTEGISNTTIINPKAKPSSVATTYTIVATIGGCSKTGQVIVTTVPYPTVNAGADTLICYDTPAQLVGTSSGTTHSWTPNATLTNANTLTPIARPLVTTSYVLTSTHPASGCPKPSRDTVIVNVQPKIHAFAGRDTSVVAGQPLQFNASGGSSYIWSPPTALSNTLIPNPIGIYNGNFESITYKVMVMENGCEDSAFVTVKIFKTTPQVFVPTAFTPNGDGRNDVIRPIAVGISKIEYFRIFNRWGQMVFSTTENGKGWDGKISGKEQGSNVYVWLVQAVDFTGKTFFAKGTVTLIR